MQWEEADDGRGEGRAGAFGISMLAMPVRVEVSLTGAPWEFRARLLEAGPDYCLLTLVSPCAPALRRGATAVLHVGTLGAGEVTFAATISDMSPRPSGLTIRCAVERVPSDTAALDAIRGIDAHRHSA
jgi:hypothetical protein